MHRQHARCYSPVLVHTDSGALPNGTQAAMMLGVPDTQLIHCPACGATNRVPLEKIQRGLQAVCGRCKTPLSLRSTPVTVTDATFSLEVERSPLPVLVDMWARGCGRGR